MSESHEYCVILAGGTGLNFWPLSREDRPKQFYNSDEGKPSFLQKTYSRMLEIFDKDHIYISSLTKFRDLIYEQLPDIAEDRLILEPYGRNTGPTIAFSTYTLLARDQDAVMAVIPCDQEIADTEIFARTMRQALDYVGKCNALLTLGIVPDRPDTNFGYVQVEGEYASGTPVKAKTFTEKPSEELAKVFVDSGEFLWNSGIFVWKAAAIREEMHECCPEITRLWKGWQKELGKNGEDIFVEKVYTDSPNISIDYAVLEKSRNLFVLPADFGWSDVGGWNAFYENSPGKDADGNLVSNPGKTILGGGKGNIVYGTSAKKLMLVSGLENFVVVDTEDALLIAPRDEKALKETLSALKNPDNEKFR